MKIGKQVTYKIEIDETKNTPFAELEINEKEDMVFIVTKDPYGSVRLPMSKLREAIKLYDKVSPPSFSGWTAISKKEK